MNKLVYLDYAATTPIDEQVAQKMMKYMTFDGVFGNPASRSHGFGWQAEEAVETAREQIAELINADPREIVFTSGATESDNLAIKGVAQFYSGKGKHIITSKIEHKAVLDVCRELETEGFEITYLDPQPKTGLITVDQVKDAIREDNCHYPSTSLVCVESTHNKTGGRVLKPAFLQNLREIIDEHNNRLKLSNSGGGKKRISLHMDGARIFNAGVPTCDFSASHA
jgi:cysteine sulfinate desulfinase/cysteine desulfurase-like protein